MCKCMRGISPFALIVGVSCCVSVAAWAEEGSINQAVARCEALASVDFSGIQDAPTQILATRSAQAADQVPAYCEIEGYVAPQVGFELRLPMSQWNGKFLHVGCGGSCGMIAGTACENSVRRGYACIAGDMGHKGAFSDSLWSYNNLQAEFDFGVRATHVTALAGKAIAAYFYGQALGPAYFAGCSNGGLQAMTEAQRFPWDFAGIIAGAPGLNETGYYLDMLWDVMALTGKKGKSLLTPADLQFVHETVIAQCDMGDGIKDGIIGDPRDCKFQPATLICKSGQKLRCLTVEQAEAVQKIYDGPVTSDGRRIAPGGASVGSELNWIDAFIGQKGNLPWYTMQGIGDMFRYRAFWPDPAPTWEPANFNFDRDYKRLGMMESLYTGANPDLRKFKAAGGKLIMYQGWSDPLSLPLETIDYFDTMERTMGGHAVALDFARLFMVPGMNHCSGGEGPFAIDYLSYLEAWVEKGRPPDAMIGAHVAGLRGSEAYALKFPLDSSISIAGRRPIYPYPAKTMYKGSGDARQAENWKAVEP